MQRERVDLDSRSAKLVEQGVSPDPKAVADTGTPLKELATS